MGVRINTYRDHQALAEDPETILYGSKTGERPPDESQWASVIDAEVFAIDKRRMTTDSLLAKAELAARVSKKNLSGIIPKVDDLWKRPRDGTYYRVVSVDVLSFGNEFRLHSSKIPTRGPSQVRGS